MVLTAALAAAAVAVLCLPRTAALRLPGVVEGGAAPGETAGGLAGQPRTAFTRASQPVRSRQVPVWLVAASVGLAVALLVGPVPGLLAAVGLRLGARARHRRRRLVDRRAERARAVEACATLAAELRAGRAAADALTAAAALALGSSGRALAAAAAAARLGGDVVLALRPDADSPVPEVQRALAACWQVCAGSGSGLAAAVERLEQGLRADQEQRRAVAAELAGPRATAGLLAVLPLAGLLLATGLGADPVRVLLLTPVGVVCLSLGLALDALGLAWTNRLVARAGGSP